MNDQNKQYQEALDYLYSYIDFSLVKAFRYAPEEFDLGRMHDLVNRMGNPQNAYEVIHIAGSKGKGSTASFIVNALITAGYKVGLYSSPHLQEFTERIQVNNQEIPKADFIRLVNKIKEFILPESKLTTFELAT
nr:hypothetical protein [Anaerolineaceae bacterium]